MSGWKVREPAGNVFFAQHKCLTCKKDKRIEDGAPGHLVFIARIVEMTNSDRVFGEGQGARARIPDCESPVSNELCEATASPALKGGSRRWRHRWTLS